MPSPYYPKFRTRPNGWGYEVQKLKAAPRPFEEPKYETVSRHTTHEEAESAKADLWGRDMVSEALKALN